MGEWEEWRTFVVAGVACWRTVAVARTGYCTRAVGTVEAWVSCGILFSRARDMIVVLSRHLCCKCGDVVRGWKRRRRYKHVKNVKDPFSGGLGNRKTLVLSMKYSTLQL